MAYPTDRVQLFDRDMNPLPELAPSEVFSRVRHEEINGEHELVIVTTRRMEEGWRALTVDGSGRWREWVVVETPESHEDGGHAIGTYRLVWSLQYDLTNSYAHVDAVSIGLGADTTAAAAAAAILDGVSGWSVGNCDAAAIKDGTGCVLIYESSWSKLSKVIECSTAEADAVIEVSNIYGVTARRLCLRSHVGSETATRRFDWGSDVTGIRRTPDPGPYFCRVVPLGKGQTEYADDDETTFEWPLDITDETGDPDLYYIEDADAALAFRRSDGNGGWIYPTLAVSYNEDDPELLLAAAMDDLHNHTRPNVTYEADVVQFARAGMDVQGVALGDDVQIVDRGFNPGSALRLQGRVTVIDTDELSIETDTELTIGNLRDNITDAMVKVDASLDDLVKQNDKTRDDLAHMTTARYIDELLARINTEINATGGYAYFVPGEGIITYDVAVTDPLVGSEASQVVQIKGGSIRIANSKQTGFAGIDDWDWRTVFTAGHISADLVTAVQIISGYIGSVGSGNFWNLDTGELTMAATSHIGQWTLQDVMSGETLTQAGVLEKLTGGYANEGLYINNGHLYINGSYILTGFLGNQNGSYWDLDNGGLHMEGDLVIRKAANSTYSIDADIDNFAVTDARGVLNGVTTEQTMSGFRIYHTANDQWSFNNYALYLVPNVNIYGQSSRYNSALFSSRDMTIASGISGDTINTPWSTYIDLKRQTGIRFGQKSGSYDAYIDFFYNGIVDAYGYYNSTLKHLMRLSSGSEARLNVEGTIQCTTIVANNLKSRLVETEDYGNRKLYCYEMPSPMFGDIGSGVIGSDGVCYVEIDDVFAETSSTNISYQVFLQKCGEGDLWVSEKSSAYFVVKGTPNLPFDWEIKAKQSGFETVRLEDDDLEAASEDDGTSLDGIVEAYEEELDYVSTIERLYA